MKLANKWWLLASDVSSLYIHLENMGNSCNSTHNNSTVNCPSIHQTSYSNCKTFTENRYNFQHPVELPRKVINLVIIIINDLLTTADHVSYCYVCCACCSHAFYLHAWRISAKQLCWQCPKCTQNNNKLSCRRVTARRFVSLNISPSHSRTFEMVHVPISIPL